MRAMMNHKATPTLCIIDMQEDFPASQNQLTINAILRMIALFRSRNFPIIAVEFCGFGKTLPELREALKGYERVRTVQKFGDNGADEISQACIDMGINVSCHGEFYVTGINTGACVRRTVDGLLRLQNRVVVVRKACNQPRGGGWDTQEYYIKLMQRKGAVLYNGQLRNKRKIAAVAA